MSSPTPPRPARTLPATPSLEQQKKQARELLDAVRAGDAVAFRRFQANHPQCAALPETDLRPHKFSLHQAQLVIAREYGFPSWPRLKAHIEQVLGVRRTRPFMRELSYYDDRARGLLTVVPDGIPSAIAQVRTWHPRYAAASVAFCPTIRRTAHCWCARWPRWRSWPPGSSGSA